MAEAQEDIAMMDSPSTTPNAKQSHYKGHEITSKTIATPPFSYACLQLLSNPAAEVELDELTVRTHIMSALTQFLGLTGSAISVDILKVNGSECWIRVPREDLAPVIAAMGGWVGGRNAGGQVGWRVMGSGNWLSVLVAHCEAERIWKD